MFRLLAVALATALVVLVSPAAQAAMAVVPMCGENAQSIQAPPIILGDKGHVLERVPCPDQQDFEVGRAPADGPRPSSHGVDDSPQRVCPLRVTFPRSPRMARLSVADDRVKPQSGFAGSIERPPRRV